MKKKILIGIICIVVILVGIFIGFNISTETEQTVESEDGEEIEIEPEEEVSEEENYSTNVKLYFVDSSSGVLSAETREVDARELIDNPYLYVLKLLIQGPKEKNLINSIPDGTRVNRASLTNGTLNIDLSEEFLNSSGTNSIYSLVNTMYEFNEIDNIKITINGQEKDQFKDKFLKIK